MRPPPPILALALSLSACIRPTERIVPGDTGGDGPVDADSDGSLADVDCDDLDPAVHPGADEGCNGWDDDCDGSVDEDLFADWYRDRDGDGYGDEGTTAWACAAPSGFIATGGDCDDEDPGVNPDTLWYYDGDDDGFGDEDSVAVGCERPQDHAAQGGDCDDHDESVHPDAPERCDDRDNDCDGRVDDDDDDVVGAVRQYRDADGDGYGSDLDPGTVACLYEGYVRVAGDCDDYAADTYPGAPEACSDTIDHDCSGYTGPATLDFSETVDPAVLSINGDALEDHEELFLTQSRSGQAGTAFFTDIETDDSFSVSFSYYAGGGSGGDGLAFAFLTETDPTLVGEGSSGMALRTLTGWAVEVDTYRNSTWYDDDGNHIALVQTEDQVPIASQTMASNLDDGMSHDMEVVFDGGAVEVWYDGELIIETTIADYAHSDLMLGFGAATGSSYNAHAIDDVIVSCD